MYLPDASLLKVVITASNYKKNKRTDDWKLNSYKKQCCKCCGKLNERHPLQLCGKCQNRVSASQAAYRARIKQKILNHYGDVCACCKEGEVYFLSVDHINNDGYKEEYSGYKFYHKLINSGYPKGFRILCHNCNLGRHMNGGVCPHENKRQSSV